MQKWINHHHLIDPGRARARRRAGSRSPASDLATSLNLMNERTMLAAFAAEEPSIAAEQLVDTLAHVWVTSIYGNTPR